MVLAKSRAVQAKPANSVPALRRGSHERDELIDVQQCGKQIAGHSLDDSRRP